MTPRAQIIADLRKALLAFELTPAFIEIAKGGDITKLQLIQLLDDALALAISDTYEAFAERAGSVPSLRQVRTAAQNTLFAEIAESTLDQVQDIAGRSERWTERRLIQEMRRAVQMTARDVAAVENYDRDLRKGDRKALRRALRDRRFERTVEKGPVTDAVKRRKMVDRYRERIIAARARSIARDVAAEAEAVTENAHWTDRAAAGDRDALRVRKFWGNRGDGAVRDAHVQVPLDYPDGLPLDGVFETALGPMRFPRDPQGTIKNKAGCRCRPIFRLPKLGA